LYNRTTQVINQTSQEGKVMQFFKSNGPMIGIASRHEVEQLEELHSDAVLISINNPEDQLPKIKAPFDDILTLKFDDIDGSEYLMADEVLMTEEQADQIAHFVNKHKFAEAILCHCQAGISRSAGCAAAIIKASGASDIPVFSDYQYMPNRHVYRLVLNALLRYNTEEDQDDKSRVQPKTDS